jgi:hypothetical protein
MSETTATPETTYSSFSEASDNDVRLTAEEIAAQNGEPVEQIEADEPEAQAAEVAAEAEAEDTETETEREAREAKLARDLREERRRARQLAAENQALRGQRPESRDEVIQREAAALAVQYAQRDAVTKKSNEIYAEGVKEFGKDEFDDAVQAMGHSFGQQLPYVIDTLIDLPDAQKLIQHLADNPDMMDSLASMPPHKLAAALAREANKVSAPKSRPMSKAPKPIRPVATRGAAEPEIDMEKMSMEQLARMWDKRDMERRNR